MIKQMLDKLKKAALSVYVFARAKYKKYSKRAIIVRVSRYALFLFLALCILMLVLFFYYTYDLPRPEKFTETPFIQSTKIYDRTGLCRATPNSYYGCKAFAYGL